MKNILEYKPVREIIDIATLMYSFGWDESNGGNISYLLDEEELVKYLDTSKIIRTFPLNFDASPVKGRLFLITGTGKLFRKVKLEPECALGIFRVAENGLYGELVWGLNDGGLPTSETYAHLMIHIQRLAVNKNHRVVLHTHPTNIITMTHTHELDEKKFTKSLWSVMTECIVVFPEGIGLLPWMLSGTYSIAEKTAEKMVDRRLVIWGLHGIYGAGETVDEAFGLIETVEKAAEIHLKAVSIGNKNYITDEQLQLIAKHYNRIPRSDYLDV